MSAAPTVAPWAVAAPVVAWLIYAGTWLNSGPLLLIAPNRGGSKSKNYS